jgi:hypothetical protein
MEARALGLQRAAELTWALQTLTSAEVSAKSVLPLIASLIRRSSP